MSVTLTHELHFAVVSFISGFKVNMKQIKSDFSQLTFTRKAGYSTIKTSDSFWKGAFNNVDN